MFVCTNKASSVFAAIEKIASTSSKKEKEAMVAAAATSSPLFVRVVRGAYTPNRTYGLRQIPHKTEGIAPGANTLDEQWVWDLLEDMADRKLTGDAMRAKVQETVNLLDEPSSNLFRRILDKDLRAGFTEGTINRVHPGTIGEAAYMRCTLPEKSNMDDWDWEAGIFSQEKHDGQFLNCNHDATGYVWFANRSGQVLPVDALEHLCDAAKLTFKAGTQTHGEGLIYRNGVMLSRKDGNGIFTSLLKGGRLGEGEVAVFVAWDQIPLSAAVPKGKCLTPYRTRLKEVVTQVQAGRAQGAQGINVSPTLIVKSYQEAQQHFKKLLLQKREGTICKHQDMIWFDTNTGNKDQVKLKLTAEFELRIKGYVEGRPGKKTELTFGSLQCESECGQVKVDVSGMSDAIREMIHADRSGYIDTIITVAGNELLEPGKNNAFHSIFLPRFIEIRADKTKADTLEEIKAIFAAAKEATA